MKTISKGNEFFDEWSVYDQVLNHNYMHHDELYDEVHRTLTDRYGDRPFTVLDLGCGSARHLTGALQGRSVSRYVGFDLSDVALAHAARNLSSMECPVELCRGDLLQGLRTHADRFDLIFTSFALHHFAAANKSAFFESAYSRLNETGLLLLIDTMRDDGEDRQTYLERYCAWLGSACKTLSPEAVDLLCAHIRNNDYPEKTGTLQAMAREAGFGSPLEVSSVRWHHVWYFEKAAAV